MAEPVGNLIQLRAARTYRPDVQALARHRLATAVRASRLPADEFAQRTGELVGYYISAEGLESWTETGTPPGDVLIAADLVAREHGSAPAPGDIESMRLLADYADLQDALLQVISDARETLAVTGSRSRDPDYLARIETAIGQTPDLLHYRVLYGPPRHAALRNHLLRLVDLRPTTSDTLRIGIVRDLLRDSERFICASESSAVVILPSLSSMTNFDTGLHFVDPAVARHYVAHVRQAYLGADALLGRAAIEDLQVVR